MKKKRKTLRKQYKPLILPNAPNHKPVIKPPHSVYTPRSTQKVLSKPLSLEQRLQNLGPSNDPDLEQAIAKHKFNHSLDPSEIANAAMTLYGPKSKQVSFALPDVPTHTPTLKKRGGKKRKTKKNRL